MKQFQLNTAHSNGMNGLYMSKSHSPREYSCQEITYDYENLSNPYHRNNLMTSNIDEFTAHLNGYNGVMLDHIGDVRVNRLTAADNLIAGIQI